MNISNENVTCYTDLNRDPDGEGGWCGVEGADPAGLTETLHEVGDVHVRNGAEVDPPAGPGTVVRGVQAGSVGQQVPLRQTAALHQLLVQPVEGLGCDGLRLVVGGEVVVQVPGGPVLCSRPGQGERELAVVEDLVISVSMILCVWVCLPTLPSYILYL